MLWLPCLVHGPQGQGALSQDSCSVQATPEQREAAKDCQSRSHSLSRGQSSLRTVEKSWDSTLLWKPLQQDQPSVCEHSWTRGCSGTHQGRVGCAAPTATGCLQGGEGNLAPEA